MGLGLQIRCSKNNLGGRSREPLEHAISTFAEAEPADPLFRRLIRCEAHEDRLIVRLHPSEEPVEFFLDGSGDLICSAKTSTAGPGYHAFVIGWLEKMESVCGLQWNWNGGDETGFHTHRDFARLQESMAAFVRNLASIVIDKAPDSKKFMLGMPLGFPAPAEDYYALSSHGFWPRGWFARMAAAEGADVLAIASEFFPWWECETGAAFWENAGRVLCWVEVPWHAPFDDREREICALALECFDRAKSLNEKIELPHKEIGELQRLITEEAGSTLAPNPEGIGFRRRTTLRSVGGGWTLRLPGYWYEELDTDQKSILYWFGDKTIQATSFSVSRQDGAVAMPDDLLGIDKAPPEALRFQQGELAGCAEIAQRQDDEQFANFMLAGKVALPNQLLLITICYEDAADEAWAIEIWRSAIHQEKGD